MTTINTMEQRCAYTLGYLKAIADDQYLEIDLSGVELTQPSVKEAIRDALGMLRRELKEAEKDYDRCPYDEDYAETFYSYSRSVRAVEKLLKEF